MDDEHLTSEELATRLKITPGALRIMRARGQGPAYLKIGRRVRYRLADVTAWEVRHQRSTSQ